jgi:hypothetical protein
MGEGGEEGGRKEWGWRERWGRESSSSANAGANGGEECVGVGWSQWVEKI